jgi:nuclear receptor subfamily 1 group D protein 3
MIGLSNGFFCVVIPQACPLNPTPAPSNGQQQLLQDFSERFLPAIRDVVEFAKRLPGFTLLAEDDKVTLLKPGVFEVLLVRLAAMFDSQVNKKKRKENSTGKCLIFI